MSLCPAAGRRDTTSGRAGRRGFAWCRDGGWPRPWRGAGEQGVDVDALERGGQEAHGGEFAGAAADPVPHGEAGEPALLVGDLVELGAGAGDRDGVLGEVEARAP